MQFPTISHMDEALDAIKGVETYFQVTPSNNYIFIKYKGDVSSLFPDPSTAATPQDKKRYEIRRECRGICFDGASKKLVQRKFHKFFNLNEKDETHMSKVNWNRPFVLLEKMDGSMVSAMVSESGTKKKKTFSVEYATMGGFSGINICYKIIILGLSKQVEDFVSRKKTQKYNDLVLLMHDQNKTCLFEWVTPDQTIVIPYDHSQLILTAIRCNKTGQYVTYKDMVQIAEDYQVPVVRSYDYQTEEFSTSAIHNGLESEQEVQHMLQHLFLLKNIEGFVLRFDDGEMHKIKTHYYAWYDHQYNMFYSLL